MPHELTENPRGALFTLHNNRPFLYWIVTFEDQRISYDSQGWLVMAKHFLQSSLLQTKVAGTLWWPAASLFLKRHHYLWGVCSIGQMHPKLHHLQLAWANRKPPVLFRKKTWTYVTRRALQKLNESKCCLTCHIHPSAPTFHHVFEHLDNVLQGTHFHSQRVAEQAFWEFVEAQGRDLYAIWINTLSSCWQKHADCNGCQFD